MTFANRCALAATALLTVAGVAACSAGPASRSADGPAGGSPAVGATASSRTAAGAPSTREPSTGAPSTTAPRNAAPVGLHFQRNDGDEVGVGMPIVVYFDRRPTDAAAFRAATTVTVDGTPVHGAWFFEQSQQKGYALEAHYRTEHFWRAHSTVQLQLPVRGLSAGRRLAYEADYSLRLQIGAAHISKVDNATHEMQVTSDGKLVKTLPVSLGAADHPTYHGTKVVSEFDRVEDMEGTPVPWSVRLTNSGEFVHAASWNGRIGSANTSHGCTNLRTDDAEWFYHFSRLGDVVEYPNAPGEQTPVWDGLGDWSLPWAQYAQGGAL